MSAPWPVGTVATVGRGSSVRDLIAELARIEDALRAPHCARAEPNEGHRQAFRHLEPQPGWEPLVPRRSDLVRRERQIVAELRRHRHQWRVAITGSAAGTRHS